MDIHTDTLESMCELIVDCPHSTPKWTENGIIVLRNQYIKNGNLDLSGPSYTDDLHYQQRIKRAKPQAGDIIFTREAPMGEVCMIPEGVKCCLGQRQVLLRPKNGINRKYLLFALQSPAVQHEISWNEGTGSTVSNVRIPVLKNLSIPRHPSHEDEIAEILGSLSDKIELNRRMNETLEAMARALFKSWFVDFDPVRAKAEGRQPEGMDAETAALFPDGFEDSELGKIPRGWRIGRLGDDFDITMGQSPPGDTYNEIGNGLPFFQGRRDFGFRYPSNRVYCTEPKRLAKQGDTLVSVRAPVGDINMAREDCCIGRGVAAVRHKSNSRSYAYEAMYTLKSHFYNFESEGTVFGSINKKDFLGLPFIIPGNIIVSAFEGIGEPLYSKIENLSEESLILTSLRDTLLPKLLSGEIRMKVANHYAKEAI